MPTLEEALRRIHLELHRDADRHNLTDPHSLGPAAVSCVAADGEGSVAEVLSLSVGGWPGGIETGIAIRSLSKMIISAAFLALVERGSTPLTMASTLSQFVPECAGSSLAHANASSLLSMRSALDNRLNAAWQSVAGTPHTCHLRGGTGRRSHPRIGALPS